MGLKFVSGGQSGVDRGALDAAMALGVAVGGWCPKGRKVEEGPLPDHYPPVELPGAGYRGRPRRNVEDSDGTLIIHFGALEGGTRFTLERGRRAARPHLLVDGEGQTAATALESLLNFLRDEGITVLNVAGPRASKTAAAHAYAFELVTGLVTRLQEHSADR